MLQSVLITTEYCFEPGRDVSDWFEMHQTTVQNKLDGLAHIHNKKGGQLRALILGDMSTVKKADILHKIEEATGLVYVRNQEVQLMPEYGNILKRLYGDKVVIK